MDFDHRQCRNAATPVMAQGARIALACMVLACLLFPCSAMAAPVRSEEGEASGRGTTAARIENTVESVYRDRRIQRELPGTQTPELPRWNVQWLGPVAKVLGWLLLGVLLAAVFVGLYLMLRNRFGMTRVREDDVESSEVGSGNAARKPLPEREPVLWGREALAEADRLAQAGDFAEAIHVLLMGGLADLRRRVARALPPSLTSREILARIEMPEAARNALAVMITMVELSRFGFRPVDSDDYGTCRERFLAFAEAEGGQG